MKIALILSGGVGQRTGLNIPKQYFEVLGKPILAYTLENFQNNELIDAIYVVCKDEWSSFVIDLAKKYNINKFINTIESGDSAQESIFNGLTYLNKVRNDNDIVIIHDGVRPTTDNFVIDNVINKCLEKGNGVTSLPYNEQIFVTGDGISSNKYIDRNTLRRVSTPQAYYLKEIYKAYCTAKEKGVGFTGSSYSNTLYADLGMPVYFAEGSDKNIKLTTKDDIKLFETYLREINK